MIRLIIYDLDGTLIDSRQDIADAVNWTLNEMGLKPLSVDRISTFVGNGVKNLMGGVLAEVASVGAGFKPAPTLGHAVKLFRSRYGEHLLDQTRPYPSVEKVLQSLRDRKQAVITNKPEDFSLRILEGLGMGSYFFHVAGGDRGLPKKPAPDAVFEIFARARISPQETVLIGDSAVDVETGRNAGVHTAAVTYGFGGREEIEAAKPDFIFEDLEELITCPLI